jgi:predicted lipid-binding transport protein (Tim44 family)
MALGQSSVTDVTDRGRLNRNSERPGGSTAMMVQHAPGTEVLSHVPNTPQPGVHTAALDPRMHTPPGMHGTGPGPHGAAPMGAGGPMGPPPHDQQGHLNYMQAPPQNTTANPVAQTFSGLDTPKKSPPVALFVGIGVLALVGLGLGGFAIVKGRSATAIEGTDPTATPSVVASARSAPGAAPAGVDSAPVAKASETAPAVDPSASAAAKDPATPASAASSAAVAAATPPAHRPASGQPAKPVQPAQPTVAAKPAGGTPPATPPAGATAKPASTQKPVNLGF